LTTLLSFVDVMDEVVHEDMFFSGVVVIVSELDMLDSVDGSAGDIFLFEEVVDSLVTS